MKTHGFEQIAAADLHRKIWNRRHDLWPFGIPPDHVDMLDPRRAAELLGYTYESHEDIPGWPPNRQSAIAGFVDPERKLILVSQRFGPEAERFTAAHEVAHLLLHKPRHALRERPISGPRPYIRDRVERSCDRFAAAFLMPENLLRRRVFETFGVRRIEVDEISAFWLDPNEPEEILRSGTNALNRAFALARCPRNFQHRRITPLHEQFKVSTSAMAYRLDELHLIQRFP